MQFTCCARPWLVFKRQSPCSASASLDLLDEAACPLKAIVTRPPTSKIMPGAARPALLISSPCKFQVNFYAPARQWQGWLSILEVSSLVSHYFNHDKECSPAIRKSPSCQSIASLLDPRLQNLIRSSDHPDDDKFGVVAGLHLRSSYLNFDTPSEGDDDCRPTPNAGGAAKPKPLYGQERVCHG